MPGKLIRHGSNAGYKAEMERGDDPCNRCRNARRVYQTQYTKSGKARGIKYTNDQVIDHLYTGRAGANRQRTGFDRETPAPRTNGEPRAPGAGTYAEPVDNGTEPGSGVPAEPGIGERLRERLASFAVPGAKDDYVATEDPPDYLHSVNADPEPTGEWSEVKDEEFVINAAGMRMIEENMGTYLSIVGMTVEMIDPYCGPIIAENFDNMINRWSKVVAHYPKAAALFLDTKGGTLFAWIGALQATWPVLYALYEHHLSKNIKTEKGRVFRRDESHPGGGVDAAMPPVPESYAYTAA